MTTGVAVGGAALARDGDGRVVFVEGALPGERVSAEIVATKRSYRSARVIEVLDSSPGRIEPVCPEVARGCGGCDLAYASGDEQRNVKASIVGDALRRIGRIEAPPPIDPTSDCIRVMSGQMAYRVSCSSNYDARIERKEPDARACEPDGFSYAVVGNESYCVSGR